MTMKAASNRLVSYPLYTVGDIASGIYTVTPSILLMFYMTNILAIPTELAALTIFISKIVDVVCSPLIGALSDRTHTRLGRRRPYLLIGSVTILPIFALMWAAPAHSPEASAYFVMICFSVCTICFSCFQVAFFALNAEIATDYHDRTSLNSYRSSYTLIGCLLAGAGAPLVVAYAGGGRAGYTALGLVMGSIMAIATAISFLNARERPRPEKTASPKLLEHVRAISGNRPFALLLACYTLHMASISLFGTTLAYFSTYILGRGTAFLSLLFFVKYGTSVLVIPLWVYIGKRLGKFRTFILCLATVAVSLFAFGFLTKDTPPVLLFGTVIFYGLVGGGVQVFVFSMLADCIRHGNRTGDTASSEATLTGLFLSGEKMGYALGAVLNGTIFGITGLVVTNKGFVTQTPAAIEGIRLAASWMPALMNVVVLLLFLFYRSFEARVVEHDGAMPRPA